MPSIQGSTTPSRQAWFRTTQFTELAFRPITFFQQKISLFKYYDEYSAKARPQGRKIVFGGSWTLRIPKPQAPTQK